jgi:hypothetical protein
MITALCDAMLCSLVEIFTSILQELNSLSSGFMNHSLTLKMEAEIFSLYMFHNQRKAFSTCVQIPHVSVVDCGSSNNDFKNSGMQALYLGCKSFLVSLKNLVIQT